MSTRDPAWSASQAASLRASENWLSPDITVSWGRDPTGMLERGATIQGAITEDERFDIVRVNLTVGNAYYFTAAQTSRPPVVELFDWEGFRLRAVNQDEVGREGAPNVDTLVDFRPTYSGDYFVRITGTQSFPITYAFGAIEDINADYLNNANRATVAISSANVFRPEGQWGSTEQSFTLTRTGGIGTTHSVEWFVAGAGGPPATASDFVGGVLPSGRVTFAPFETQRTVTFSVVADVEREADEGFSISLRNPSANLSLGPVSWTMGAIMADEPTITGWGSWNVREEGQAGTAPLTFALERSSGLDSWDWVDWSVSGSGANPANAADFAGGALPTGRAFFAPGERWSIITVNAAGDREREADEEFTLSLTGASPGALLATSTLTGRILADEPSIRAWGSWNVREEGQFGSTPLTFAAERTGSLDAWDWVDWLVVGSGANPVDHADFAGGLRPWGRAAFAPGERWAVITVDVAGDTLPEPDEEFTLRLMNPSPGVNLLTTELTGRILADEPTIRAWGSWNFRAEGQSGVTPLTFAAERSGDLDSWAWVDWLVTGSGANPADGADFAGGLRPWGRAVFAPGERWSVITVNVAGDAAVEPDESFTLNLANPSPGVRLLTTQLEGRILADEPSYAIAATNATRAEGNAGTTPFTFTVTRTGPTDAAGWVDWALSGTGANPADAADFGGALPSGRLNFAAGQSSATLTINVAGDTSVEPDESFRVTLTGAAGGAAITTATADGRILTDDQLFSIGAPASAQGEAPSGPVPFTFTVTRIGATEGAATITWAVVGSGANPANAADFGGTLPSGSLDFAPGQTSRQVTVNLASDAIAERQEGFAVVLSSPSSGGILTGRAEATILADVAPTVSIADLRQVEGHAGRQVFNFAVSLDSARDVATTVDWAVSALPGGATLADFQGGVFPTGRATIAAGQTSAVIPVAIRGDTAIEPDEGFTVTLSNPSAGAVLGRAAATGTIANDDSGFAIAANAPSTQGEPTSGVTPFTFTVTRSGAIDQAAQVSWAVVGSGATPANAADFGGALPGGVLSFAPGEASRTITVNVVNDGIAEPQERFAVQLSSPSAGTVLTGRAEATILASSAPTISIADLSQAEGHLGRQAFNFVVTLDAARSVASTVDWAVTGLPDGASAADFWGNALPSGRATIAAGQTSVIVPIGVRGDVTLEANEGFTVTLSNPSAGVVLGDATANGIVLNDDATFAIANHGPSVQAEGPGGSGTVPFQFMVTRAGILDGTVEVGWRVIQQGSNSVDMRDFGGTAPTGRLTFLPGETSKIFTIDAANNDFPERDERFIVTLESPPPGHTFNPPMAAMTILGSTPVVSMAYSEANWFSITPSAVKVTVNVQLDIEVAARVSVDWAASGDGIAIVGDAPAFGRVTFAPNSRLATFELPIEVNRASGTPDDVTITLSNPSTGVVLGRASSTIPLAVDWTTITLTPDARQQAEGTGGTTEFGFTVARTGDLSQAESVNWAVDVFGTPTDAQDFAGGVLPFGRIDFAPGETSKRFSVAVAADNVVENSEIFRIGLSGEVEGTALKDAGWLITILNDDLI